MPSVLDTPIGRGADEQLRSELRVADLRRVTDFGLGVDALAPGIVRLPHRPVRRGLKVDDRDGTDRSIFEVAAPGLATAPSPCVDPDEEPERCPD